MGDPTAIIVTIIYILSVILGLLFVPKLKNVDRKCKRFWRNNKSK